MLNFGNFIIERSGYSTEVEELTTYIINYVENKEDLKNIEEIDVKILNIGISKIIIEFKEDYAKLNNRFSSFDQHKSEYIPNGSIIYLVLDSYKTTHGLLNHELFHAYDWVKNKGKELTSVDEMSIISMYDFFKNDKQISTIIDVFYSLSSAEVKADFSKIVYEIKNYELNENETIDNLVKKSDFYQNFYYLKDINLLQLFNDLSELKLNKFLSAFELLKKLKHGEEEELFINNSSKKEQKLFIDNFLKIYNNQIKNYSRYISKLFSFFENKMTKNF